MRFLPRRFPSVKLQKGLEVEMRKPGMLVVPITQTVLWQFWAIGPDKRYGGRGLFHSIPWKRGETPKPKRKEGRPPKVLALRGAACPEEDVVVSVAELLARAEKYEPQDARASPWYMTYSACVRHNFTEARFAKSGRLSSFWPAFLGHENFMDVPQTEWDIPDLIVGNGEMRNYDDAGETVMVADSLIKLALMCSIPIEFPQGIRESFSVWPEGYQPERLPPTQQVGKAA